LEREKKLEITFEFHYKCDENFCSYFYKSKLPIFEIEKNQQTNKTKKLLFFYIHFEKQYEKVTRYLVFFLLLPIISSVH